MSWTQFDNVTFPDEVFEREKPIPFTVNGELFIIKQLPIPEWRLYVITFELFLRFWTNKIPEFKKLTFQDYEEFKNADENKLKEHAQTWLNVCAKYNGFTKDIETILMKYFLVYPEWKPKIPERFESHTWYRVKKIFAWYYNRRTKWAIIEKVKSKIEPQDLIAMCLRAFQININSIKKNALWIMESLESGVTPYLKALFTKNLDGLKETSNVFPFSKSNSTSEGLRNLSLQGKNNG